MPIPTYYNPYMNAYPVQYQNTNPYVTPYPMQQYTQQQSQPQYMYNVDGENAAKSWQPNVIPQPNTIIPLFDSDGQHIYFKTYDAYGRMNPLRKGRIVFDDEINISETSAAPQMPDMSNYVTKADFEAFRKELLETRQQQNQNGNNFRGDRR